MTDRHLEALKTGLDREFGRLEVGRADFVHVAPGHCMRDVAACDPGNGRGSPGGQPLGVVGSMPPGVGDLHKDPCALGSDGLDNPLQTGQRAPV